MNPRWYYPAVINSLSGDIGRTIGAHVGSTPSSGAFPAANDAILVPFTIPQSITIKRLYWINGTAVSGNVDAGVYTADGALITATGSTAQAGTNAPQFVDVTDFVLGAGRYYWAVALDNNTGTLFRSNLGIARLQALGAARMATAFPLPATITFATANASFWPLVGGEPFRGRVL